MESIVSDIINIIENGRQKAYHVINTFMVESYWLIGQRIVEDEQQGKSKAGYGDSLLKILSKGLSKKFGSGFSPANLRNFRQFYLTYPDIQKCYALRSKLSWTHHRTIMRVENERAREYYIREAEEQNWSTRSLERNINSLYYERLLSSKDKKIGLQISIEQEKNRPEDFIKDPYVFEILNIPQSKNTSEKNVESALIQNLQQFLLELGKGFSFVGRQYSVSTELEHFYIDLVFYNYLLKSFVLIDLKVGKLTHQDIGQMDMYRRLFDDLKKPEGDNPTIGIILCTEKSETVVKYSVMNDSQQLFATKYMMYLPSEDELVAEIEREKNLLREQGVPYGKED
ncbi:MULTISPECIES: YhcG family protein [Sphingobacterium]|uniref:PDDEXK nuclease domain-containing protein n=1 Tax=Sphingobacterium TaxID=28453 RepID=UPI0013D9BCDD|nr:MULTISPECIES: PDDEXK nuclease domain-containing protein [unclassified Sphingobacterium]